VALGVGLEEERHLVLPLGHVHDAEHQPRVGALVQLGLVERGGQLVEPRPPGRRDAGQRAASPKRATSSC
jgi:hypothetical protein